MSAGLDFNDGAEALVESSLDGLAPKMRERVEAALADANRHGLDAVVYESTRSDELQRLYYARGRTTVPPYRRVTNASTAQDGWHFYGLAVDVISKRDRWEVRGDWWLKLAAIFKEHGLDWGGDWESPDDPHFQFAGLRKSPSDKSKNAYQSGGKEAVWELVGAE